MYIDVLISGPVSSDTASELLHAGRVQNHVHVDQVARYLQVQTLLDSLGAEQNAAARILLEPTDRSGADVLVGLVPPEGIESDPCCL